MGESQSTSRCDGKCGEAQTRARTFVVSLASVISLAAKNARDVQRARARAIARCSAEETSQRVRVPAVGGNDATSLNLETVRERQPSKVESKVGTA